MNKHYSLDEVNFISEKISGGTSPEDLTKMVQDKFGTKRSPKTLIRIAKHHDFHVNLITSKQTKKQEAVTV